MPITVRLALNVETDQAEIVDMNCRLARETENKQLDQELIGRGVRAVLADSHKGRYFLACEAQQILGQTLVTWEYSDWRAGWFWWIQSVYVKQEFRGRGVFRSIFQTILESAKVQGDVIGVRLYVEKNNERARNIYTQLGLHLEPYEMMMLYPLPPAPYVQKTLP